MGGNFFSRGIYLLTLTACTMGIWSMHVQLILITWICWLSNNNNWLMLRTDYQLVAMKYCDFWLALLYIFSWRKQILTTENITIFWDTEFSISGMLPLKLAEYRQFIRRMKQDEWRCHGAYCLSEMIFVTHTLLLYKFVLKS